MEKNSFERTVLWEHGKGGYSLFHVFSVIAAENSILCFAEARAQGNDAGEAHDIVMRRSTDGGKSFTPSVRLFGGEGLCLTNPTPIYDAAMGRVLLFFAENFENTHTTLYLSHSDDLGITWSAPQDVTHFITQKSDTSFHLPGPTHGIQLQKSPCTGRLLLQLWHRGHDVTLPRTERGYCASLLYSDDHGKHWEHVSPLGHALCGNESALCETDAGVLWTLRAFGTQHAMTTSTDGGITWDEGHPMPLPPAFACQAGVISLPNDRQTVLLSRVSRPEKECRRDIEIRISRDGGKSFPAHLALPQGDAYPGYSDLCATDGGNTVGLLHCHEGRVLFSRIPHALLY